MMTIKRQWLLVLILSAIAAVMINSLVLSALINRYFVNYTAENYSQHLSQIVALSQKTLLEKDFTPEQIAIQLAAHLNDPILEIKLYDAHDRLLADVGHDNQRMNGMMKNGMMNRMMGDLARDVQTVQISDDGVLLGHLMITKYSSIGNTLATRMFKTALISNSVLSFAIVLVLVILIGVIVSRKMSRDLLNTSALACSIDLGDHMEIRLSKVREIRTIQQTLMTLKSRLQLKQTSRKRLVDELVHQTRTPLTILKAHLEGIGDGLITMTTEEITVCEAQIENITSIIANMSGMIDAEKEIDTIKIEKFELEPLPAANYWRFESAV